MIIDDFHVFGTRFGPAEADAPLFVDADDAIPSVRHTHRRELNALTTYTQSQHNRTVLAMQPLNKASEPSQLPINTGTTMSDKPQKSSRSTRRQLYIPDFQWKELDKLKEFTGIGASEHIRAAIHDYLVKKKQEMKSLGIDTGYEDKDET